MNRNFKIAKKNVVFWILHIKKIVWVFEQKFMLLLFVVGLFFTNFLATYVKEMWKSQINSWTFFLCKKNFKNQKNTQSPICSIIANYFFSISIWFFWLDILKVLLRERRKCRNIFSSFREFDGKKRPFPIHPLSTQPFTAS